MMQKVECGEINGCPDAENLEEILREDRKAYLKYVVIWQSLKIDP